MTWQVCALVLLLIAVGFHFGRGAKSKPLAVDPGPLSAKHASFTASEGCAACHPAQDAGLGGFVKAVFSHADMNTQCSTCHKFDGLAHQPHNEIFDTNPRARETDCRQCHTEHQGANANLTTITDAQCHTCHKVQFERFDKGHPPFAANFPHVVRGGIKFNHAKHLLEYFKQPEHAARAQKTCAECHTASPGERNIRTAGFDAACARCHEDQIPQTELVLLRLPERPAEAAKLTPDDATTFMAWFLQRVGATNYGTALQQFMVASAEEGAASLASELNRQAGTNAGAVLVAGLSPELLARPAQLWLKGEAFEPPSLKVQSGWYWLEDLYPELRYKPAGHADAVTRAWLEFSLVAAAGATNASDAKRAADFRNEVAHQRTGAGRCVKCHAVTAPASQPERPRVVWRYVGSQLREHTKFSHGAHLGLTRCDDCHALNSQANYEDPYKDSTTTAGVSNFKSIALANCTGCHAEKKIRSDCTLCHQYHRETSLREIAVSK
jgi:predicted CXXCH cytochrome family protein